MRKFLQISGACLWLFLLVWLFATCNAQYRINKEKLIGLSIVSFAGCVDGIVEGYEFDGRSSFERKWGVEPYSFFGSMSWDMPMNGFEKRFGQFDFYHLADDTRKVSYIGGGVMIGIGGAKLKQKKIHYLYDFLISAVVSGGSKAIGMHYIRKIDSF